MRTLAPLVLLAALVLAPISVLATSSDLIYNPGPHHFINGGNSPITVVPASQASSTNPLGPNIVPNNSFEQEDGSGQPLDWGTDHWGTNAEQFIYPVAGEDDAYAAEVDMTSYSSGDAKWYFTPQPTATGTVYMFSDWYQASVTTDINVDFLHADGTHTYLDLGNVPASATWQHTLGYFTVPNDPTIVSLTVFHLIESVGTLTVDNFSLRQIPSDPTKFNQGYVSINFDDGYLTTYENSTPILDAAGFKSDDFIVTGRMYDGFKNYIKVAQILALQADGQEIDAHTRTHPDLLTLTKQQAWNEIYGSKEDLAAIGITPNDVFAYPYGDYDEALEQLVQKAGFIAGRSSDGGYDDKTTDHYALVRQGMRNTTTMADVENWVETAQANKTWLILVFHQVDDSNNKYAVTPQFFQQIVTYLQQQNITPITMDQGMALMGK